jgi:hypothetical protein
MDYAAALQAYNRLLEMQSPLLPATEPAPPPVDERATAFGRGLGLEPLQLAYSRAVTQRVFAEQYGTPEQAEAARLAEQEAIAEIQRFQEVNPSVGLFDIENVGDVGSFAGEVLGGEATDLAIQLGATGTGAGIGALFGPALVPVPVLLLVVASVSALPHTECFLSSLLRRSRLRSGLATTRV